MRTLARILGGLALLATALRGWIPTAGGVWPDGGVALALEYAGAPGSRAADWDLATREAIDEWNGHLQRIQLSATPGMGEPGYSNGRNEMFFGDRLYGETWPEGVLAVAIITTDDAVPTENDVVFNAAVGWSVYRGPLLAPEFDFRRVALHELGHVLGLDHPDEAAQEVVAVMNSTISQTDSLTGDDQAGVHALYDFQSMSRPVILQSPAPASAEQGGAVRLDVTAGGRGPFTYSWLRDGVTLPGQDAAVLRLSPVTLADAGTYTAVVTNAAGASTSSPAYLTVVATPLIVLGPLGSHAFAGGNTVAGGFIDLYTTGPTTGTRYEWKRNGATVAVTSDPRYTAGNVQFSDAGDYTVTATNAWGSVTSSVFPVKVAPGEPPQVTGELKGGAVELDRLFTLYAPVSGSAPLTYRWFKDGNEISGVNMASLDRGYFRAADAGSYWVTVSNPFGQVTTAPAELTVATPAPLTVTRHPVSISEYAGAFVSFWIEWTGDERSASFRWYKDGVALPDAPQSWTNQVPKPHYVGTTYMRFSIAGTTAADSGVYRLQITDARGVRWTDPARLTVLPAEKPFLTVHPASHTVSRGGMVNLNLAVRPLYLRREHGTSTYEWFKDGVSMGHPVDQLLLAGDPASAGRYFVRVTNAAGFTDSETAHVVVTDGPAPLITRDPASRYYDRTETAILANERQNFQYWRDAFAPSGTLTWSRDGDPVAAPFTDDGVIPGTYRVTVTNGERTQTSQPFTLGLLPQLVPGIAQQPENRSVDPGAYVFLSVTATSFAPMSYQWSRDGVTLAGETAARLVLENFTPAHAGAYAVTVTSPVGSTTSEPAIVQQRPDGLPEITEQPAPASPGGGAAYFHVAAAGGLLRYQWLQDGVPLPGETGDRLYVPPHSAGGTWMIAVAVSNATGTTLSKSVPLRVVMPVRPPEILFQPIDQSARLGAETSLVVGATGGPLPDRYQWRKDGVDIPGAIDPILKFAGVRSEQAGQYTVAVTNSQGTVVSAPARLTVDGRGRLINLSTRARVGIGGDILISGFVINGTQPRTVLVRAVGEQLMKYGVTGVLRNPRLELHDSRETVVATNDNWETSAAHAIRAADLQAAAQSAGAFDLAEDTADAAVLATLPPGNYTAQVYGVAYTKGVALVEVYEIGKPEADRLINLSSRAWVGRGSDIMIAGLVLKGDQPRRVLIRAVGPGLAAFGVGGVLANPTLTLFREQETIAQNDDWENQPDPDTTRLRAAQVGAFALATGSRDAAVVVELPAGNYTVHVSGVGDTTGVALVEVYEVD